MFETTYQIRGQTVYQAGNGLLYDHPQPLWSRLATQFGIWHLYGYPQPRFDQAEVRQTKQHLLQAKVVQPGQGPVWADVFLVERNGSGPIGRTFGGAQYPFIKGTIYPVEDRELALYRSLFRWAPETVGRACNLLQQYRVPVQPFSSENETR